MPIKNDEFQLITEVLRGKKSSFRPLVEYYYPKVYSYIKNLVSNNSLTDDLTQETFIRAYSKLSTFDTSRHFGPWLIKIAYNVSMKHFRKTKNETSLANSPDLQTNPSDYTQAARFSDEKLLVDYYLEKMPLNLRIMFLLKHSLEFTYEEIAEICEEPIGTVKISVHRACYQIRQQLESSRKSIKDSSNANEST
ncbi:MAG: sigma-70 family RNA polymerase sigma factor [Candidatus Riflebacteria bacterium]|nr:sigma-70 family RNA polymerase sigma factor [Candidatus Riflebacteria bacterium]